MIKQVKRKKYNEIDEIISNDIFQNIYLYIDSQMYGYDEKNIKTFILESNNEIKVILYHYYNNLQVFQKSSITNEEVQEICNHILQYRFKMISGNNKFISKIYKYLNNYYSMSCGFIMKKETKVLDFSNKTEFAKTENCEEIAQLICTDKSIGGHYKVEELKEQLIERMTTKNCVNVILKDKKIIAHAATYADCNSIAVIGGVITDKKYRGLGYGKLLVNDLTKYLQDFNKVPVLYCYDKTIVEWYESFGWEKTTECAKLELE